MQIRLCCIHMTNYIQLYIWLLNVFLMLCFFCRYQQIECYHGICSNVTGECLCSPCWTGEKCDSLGKSGHINSPLKQISQVIMQSSKKNSPAPKTNLLQSDSVIYYLFLNVDPFCPSYVLVLLRNFTGPCYFVLLHMHTTIFPQSLERLKGELHP